MEQRPAPDQLEWRNDRRIRFDLWLVFGRNVDRAAVAHVAYERQQNERREGVTDGDMGAD